MSLALSSERDDAVLGLTMAIAAGLVTICGASATACALHEPRSLVLVMGVATGGVLCACFTEMLPAALRLFEDALKMLLPRWFDVPLTLRGRELGPDAGLAMLTLACAFSIGVLGVWITDTLCMQCVVPEKMLRPSHPQVVMTPADPARFDAPRDSPDDPYALSLHAPGLDKELLYKATAARAAAFALQTIPEGAMLLLATMHKRSLGVLCACALTLLNIAQGIALAGTLRESGGFRCRSVLWCMLSTLALPLGGLLAWAVLLQTDLGPLVLATTIAIAAGILVGVGLAQLLVVCADYHGDSTSIASISVLCGMLLVDVFRVAVTMLNS